jgi:hypothetical protein
VQQTAAALLTTESFKKKTRLRECILGDAEDEGLADEECVWDPRYAIRFANFADAGYETRLIGHVEFLAGRSGALTEAYNMKHWTKWGSLRCILGAKAPSAQKKPYTDQHFPGDIAQWMLMNNNRYAFLVSSDEITFLHMEVRPISHQNKTLFYEPWLHYSPPMKITDTFDLEKEEVTVRMALLYLFCEVMGRQHGEWALDDEMGNCLGYADFGRVGEDLHVRLPVVPRGRGKEEG